MQARRLSDSEYMTFLREVPVYDLPQWGKVVAWRGMDVLVFQGNDELFLTDITGETELAAEINRAPYESDPAYLELLWERIQAVSSGLQSGFDFAAVAVPVALIAAGAYYLKR